MWKEIKQKLNFEANFFLKWEKRHEEKSCETDSRNESEEDGEKVEGVKRGALPYVATFSSPTLEIMNFQMMAGFPYFHFRINMWKWQSSIFGFK
jgi:hypothetical protein